MGALTWLLRWSALIFVFWTLWYLVVVAGNLIIQWTNEDHFNAMGTGVVTYQLIAYGGATIGFAHALAKAATGLGTSWLVWRGRYVSGLFARLALLEKARGEIPPEVSAAIDGFRGYFERPAATLVPHHAIDLYRLALRRLLDEAGQAPLERGFLSEPLSLRNAARGFARARRGGVPLGRLVRSAVEHGDPLGSWDGRRWAVAVRYWLEEGESAAWRAACRRWVGRELPHEPRAFEAL